MNSFNDAPNNVKEYAFQTTPDKASCFQAWPKQSFYGIIVVPNLFSFPLAKKARICQNKRQCGIAFEGNYSLALPNCYLFFSNGTALGGEKIDLENGSCDFMHLQDQTLEFGKGETCRQITIRVNPDSQVSKTILFYSYSI